MSQQANLEGFTLKGEATQATAAHRPILILDQAPGEETPWLWADRLPRGQVAVVAGEAGSGKSLLATAITAAVSTGAAWPDESDPKPAASVLVAYSDRHLLGAVKQRLLAAGAEPGRVAVIHRDDDLPEGQMPAEALIAALEAALDQLADCSLVVVDHLLGWLRKVNLRPDEQAQLFDRLAALAARRQIALLVVWRLEKAARNGPLRALDALLAAAPVVWMLARDPYRSGGYLAVCAHNQLGPAAENLAFCVEANRLVWQADAGRATADEVLAASARSVDRRERQQAGQWLLDLLADGPIEAKRLWEESRNCRLSERTVRRAAADLDLHPMKVGGGPWLWGFRPESGKLRPAEGGQVQPASEPTTIACSGSATGNDLGCANVAALETVGSLAHDSLAEMIATPDSAVVAVELRRDAAPSVTVLTEIPAPEAGISEADSAATVEIVEPGGQPAAEKSGASSEGDDVPRANVAALPTVGSLAKNSPTPKAKSRSQKQRSRRERRERQALEDFMARLRGD